MHQSAEGDLKSTHAALVGANEKIGALERQRRKLHNSLMRLKGNIQVLVRPRPYGGAGQPDGETCPIRVGKGHAELTLTRPEDSGRGQTGAKKYGFNHVFSMSATNADVYTEVEPFGQSAVDGFNVCIFAYGQTGSGKVS